MVDGISILGIVDISVSIFILLLLFLLITSGKLVPKRYYDEVKEDRDHFKEANKIKNAALGKYEENFKVITGIAEHTNQLVQTLLPPIEEDTDGST